MADEIKIRVATDISAIQSQMADAAETVEQFNARASAALEAYATAAAGGDEATELLAAAMRKAEASGAGYVDAITAAVAAAQAASSGGGVAAVEAPAGSTAADVELQREVAAATLEQVAARQALNAVVKDSVSNQLEDEASLDAVAAAQERLITASEALATAKKNLAASAEFDALAESTESEGSDILAAAQLQLSEATLAAKGAKSELNAAITQYAGRTDAEAIAVVANAQRLETETTEQLILAKQNLAEVREYDANAAQAEVVVNNEVAAAQNAVAISSRQAATAVIGIGEGMRNTNRAAGAFLATTLGLGPILQAAFPIIGALALVEVLVQIGTKLYDVYTKATQAGEEIARAFDESNEKIEAGNDALALSNSRLQDEIDKLEGKPSNGLQTALLEAINLADRLQSSLASDSRELESLLKKREVGYFAAALTGTVPTVGLDKTLIQQSDEIESKGYKILQTFKQEMNEAAGDKGKLAEAQKSYFDQINGLYDGEIATLKPKLDHFYELQKENNDKVATMHKLHIPTSIFTSEDIDYSPAVNALERQLRQLDDLKQRAKEMAETEPLEQKKGALEQHKGDESAANKAREKKLHEIEQGYSEEEAIYGKSAAAAAAYWDQYLGIFAQGTSQFETVLNKVNTAREQLGKKESSGDLFGKEREELKKLATEAKKDADSYQRALDEMAKAADDLKKAQAGESIRGLEQQHEQTTGTLELSHAQQESPYKIGIADNPQKELADLEKFHEQILAEDEAFIRKEIAIEQGAGEVAKAEELQNKLTQVQHKGEMQRLADEEAIQKQQLANFQKVYAAITNDLNESINKMITTTQKPAQIFAQMFDQILAQLATFVEKWIEKKIEMWAEDLALQATGQATSKTLSLGQIAQAAATAAANTYASVSAIPIVGPVLAPPAAAVAYAAVLAFEAFEHGGIVSGHAGMPVPIMAHAGERVLSAPQTQNFERMVNQSGGGTRGNTTVNYSPNINAFDRSGFRSTLQAHKDDITDIVRGAINSGALRR